MTDINDWRAEITALCDGSTLAEMTAWLRERGLRYHITRMNREIPGIWAAIIVRDAPIENETITRNPQVGETEEHALARAIISIMKDNGR